MRKQIVSVLLTVALLAGFIPTNAMAEETEKLTGIPPQISSASKGIHEGAELTASKEHSSEAFNAVAPADVDTVEEKVAWIAEQCRAEGLTKDWDIALWLHDWLVYNANYDYTYSNYDPSGVLLKGTGVCQSYAEAYCLLLDEFSIENMLLSAPEMNHAWNLVKLDGQWCHVDCTWDDPGTGGSECYTYFGMDDALMGRDHDWNRSIYPACTSKDNYYYFVRMGSNIGASKEEMEQVFHKLLSAHLTTFECTYVGTDANYSIFNALVECLGAHGPQYGLRGWQANSTQYWVRAENLSYSGAVHTHTYVSTVTEPTCMMGGYTTHTCICGDTYTDSSVTALGHNMGSWQTVKEATCAKEGSKKQTCQRSGCDYSVTDKIPATGNHTYTDKADTSCNVCGYKRTEAVETVPVYRFYNPYTNEHLLVSDEGEKNTLVNAGWTLEGVAWNAPKEGSPVYRLYNPDDWHTYTSSEEEMQAMVAAGWSLDGPVSCTATKENGRPVYRLFNPYEKTNFHLFTAGVEERDMLVNAGWILEGIAWYAAP